MFEYQVTRETAEELLNAESTCYGEGLAGLPQSLLEAIKKHFPDLAEKWGWLFEASV